MSIATEIQRLQTAKANIKTAIEAKGVSVPSSAKLDVYDDYVAQIGGGDVDYKILTISFRGLTNTDYNITAPGIYAIQVPRLSLVKSLENTFNSFFTWAFQQDIQISLDLTGWDVSNCTNMRSAFLKCRSLASLDVSNWDVSNCTDMVDMFSDIVSVPYTLQLDLRSFNLNANANISYIFNGSTKISNIRVGQGWTKGCNLSYTSMQHDAIVQFLTDLPTISDSQTITLGATKLGYLSDAEKMIATGKGWTLA